MKKLIAVFVLGIVLGYLIKQQKLCPNPKTLVEELSVTAKLNGTVYECWKR